MARYTLKTFAEDRQIERFENRSVASLREILSHPRYYRAGETGPFGEIIAHPDRFEVLDTQMEKISNGNIEETLFALGKLK